MHRFIDEKISFAVMDLPGNMFHGKADDLAVKFSAGSFAVIHSDLIN